MVLLLRTFHLRHKFLLVLLNKALSYGKLTGGIYDFEFAGDELARHTHDETTVHISIVARGSFKMVGDGWEMTAKCGDVVDFDIGQYHAFIALEPNSRLVNIVKG
jgi:quercetin dioxygenase-like cupin family protein